MPLTFQQRTWRWRHDSPNRVGENNGRGRSKALTNILAWFSIMRSRRSWMPSAFWNNGVRGQDGGGGGGQHEGGGGHIPCGLQHDSCRQRPRPPLHSVIGNRGYDSREQANALEVFKTSARRMGGMCKQQRVDGRSCLLCRSLRRRGQKALMREEGE